MARIKEADTGRWLYPDFAKIQISTIFYGGGLPMPGELQNTPIDNSTSLSISLEKSFRKQLSYASDYFTGIAEYILTEKMQLSSDWLLSCSPDAISLQLTDEGSIFYTMKKNNITIYLDHYLVETFDRDEAIVTVFKHDQKLLDFSGTLAETVEQVHYILAHEAIAIKVFA